MADSLRVQVPGLHGKVYLCETILSGLTRPKTENSLRFCVSTKLSRIMWRTRRICLPPENLLRPSIQKRTVFCMTHSFREKSCFFPRLRDLKSNCAYNAPERGRPMGPYADENEFEKWFDEAERIQQASAGAKTRLVNLYQSAGLVH